jgi:Family of unknown function (DUF6680)
MNMSDLLTIVNIAATVAAVIAAPIIALWVGLKLQAKASARQQKLQLLGVLLSLRHVPLSPIWERIKRREDLRPEFIQRGIGFPDFIPAYYPPQPRPAPTQPQQPLPQAPPPVHKSGQH